MIEILNKSNIKKIDMSLKKKKKLCSYVMYEVCSSYGTLSQPKKSGINKEDIINKSS